MRRAGVSSYISVLGPALLVSIGSMDPGNWATCIEGGSRFGYELVWVVFVANLIALLLKSLASHLGIVSGKHLAQACHDEYPTGVCVFLWFFSELSLILLDSAMVLSSAVGLNLVLGVPVLLGVLLVSVDVLLLMACLPSLGAGKAEFVLGAILLSTVSIFVLNAFISRPSVLPIIEGMWPRIKSDSLHAVVALFGANIMPQNLYLNSALYQEQQNTRQCSTYRLFDIILTGGMPIAVNLSIMVVAAMAFHNAGFDVLTLQDGYVMMEQALSRSVAPLAFGLALLCAGVFSSLTGTLVGQVVNEGFLGKRIDAWLHRLFIRAAAVLIAFLWAWTYGTEGAYQMLVLSQILLALQLPFTLVPLLRLTSSTAYMGKNKISGLIEALGWVVFVLVLALDLYLVFSTLFTQSDEWGSSGNWDFSAGSDLSTFATTLIFALATISVGFLIWLLFIPIRSDIYKSSGSDQVYQKELVHSLCHSDDGSKIRSDEVETITPKVFPAFEPVAVSTEMQEVQEPAPDNLEDVKVDTDSSSETEKATVNEETKPVFDTTVAESLSVEDSTSLPSVFQEVLVDAVSSSVPAEAPGSQAGGASAEVNGGDLLDKDEEETEAWENLEQEDAVAFSGVVASSNSAYEGPESVRSLKSDTSEAVPLGSEGGSFSRLSGLGRAARRQFAAILDEFWGRLFDLHGKPITLDAVCSPGSGMKMACQNNRLHETIPRQVTRDYKTNPIDAFGRSHSSLTASSSQTPNRWLFDHTAARPGYSLGDQQRYSSMRHFSYHEDLDCQPATIHGYNIASYIRPGPVDTSRTRSQLDMHSRDFSLQGPFTHYSKSALQPDNGIMHGYSLSQESGDMFLSKVCQRVDDAYADRHTRLEYDSGQWSSSSNKLGDKWNPLVYRATGELDKSLISDAGLSPRYGQHPQVERAPLSFDDISPSQSHRDGFSIQAASQTDSLWSRQPFEQLFGAPGRQEKAGAVETSPKAVFSLSNGVEFGLEVFEQLRFCVRKLLQIEGSDWLFPVDNGCDEDLIAGVAAREKALLDTEVPETMTSIWQTHSRAAFGSFPVQPCGEACVWGSTLLVSFGVWCVHRVLELAFMESRPELWGKYTYVLNRLQGVLEPAFSSPRTVLQPCTCLHGYQHFGRRTGGDPWSIISNPNGKPANSNVYLEMIKEVETAVGSRKGRTGTVAGDVAFPKGKENLASVLKRYKRRLGNRSANCGATNHARRPSCSSSPSAAACSS